MNTDDFKNNKDEWIQRSMVNDKYTWTISGVIWNNIKGRTNPDGPAQSRSPNYRGCVNDFKGFQEFVNWHRKQIGYGFGYDLDADMLRVSTKRYSEDTCLLVPCSLNRFIQSYGERKSGSHQGVHPERNKLRVLCLFTNDNGKSEVFLSKLFKKDDLQEAMNAYVEAKNECGQIWYERLLTSKYTVDQRVKDYMKNWKFQYEVGMNV